MDNQEARSILSLYRAGESESADARFAEAKQLAETNPDLARWWKEEQELDRIIGSKLQGTDLPAGLKRRLVSAHEPVVSSRFSWSRPILLAAAAIVALAVLFGAWRGPFQPFDSLADYRDEMVGFIKVAPALELETKQLSRVTAFLEKTGAPSRLDIPSKLRDLEPVGCRTLRFRGHDVALICFKREGGRLLHLFVVNRAALPHLPHGGARNSQGEWMTAAWVEDDHAYLMTVQGDRAALDKYLTNS